MSHQVIWRESPFTQDELSWPKAYPELHKALLLLSDSELEQLWDENKLLEFLAEHLPSLDFVRGLRAQHHTETSWKAPRRAIFGIPGRKLDQIEGFISVGKPLTETNPEVVDWCSGRGYLARLLYYAGASKVVCFEKDPELCQHSRVSHGKMDAELSQRVLFQVQDVLQEIEKEMVSQGMLHTALHACGALHMSMLKQVAKAKVEAIICSPCCYHLIAKERHRGLSSAAQASGFTLSRTELKLATAELCTANTIERNLGRRELLWRVAFDLRSREVRGDDVYQPTPSIKKSLLKGSFQDFVAFMLRTLEKKGRKIENFGPLSAQEEQRLLARAQRKLSRILRLEKARLGFRKALEYWLLLDRMLFLEENGYRVELKEFCSKSESARNILIMATACSFVGESRHR